MNMSFLGSLRNKIASWTVCPYLMLLIVFLFQLSLLTRAKVLYTVIEALFFGLIGLLAVLFIRAPRRTKIVVLVFGLFIVGLRLPFLLHPTGLITTSDNALDALQSLEIRDNRTMPFFLLDAVKHMGTIKYLFVSFLWDAFGVHYLLFVLLQLAMFSAILYFIYKSLQPAVSRNVLLIFVFLNFAFVETLFDNSMSIRAGSYIEMLFFFFFGVFLFDWEFRRPSRMFLSYAFIFFSIYLHPLAALFAASFLACTLSFSIGARAFFKNAALAASGAAAGLFHWFYYLAFLPKPVAEGGWEKIGLRPLSGLSPRLVVPAAKNLAEAFRNILSYEFSYLTEFFKNEKIEPVAVFLSRLTIGLAAAAAAAGLALSIVKIVRWLRKKDVFSPEGWICVFLPVLWMACFAKMFLLDPPLLEPRHNFDLVFATIFGILLVFSRFVRIRKIVSLPSAAVVLLLAALTLPHYYYYLKNAGHKDVSNRELMTALYRNKVRYLETDFIIAYPVYFLSNRRILVSDSLGPFTIKNFYPRMKEDVDAVPRSRKAYLFFNDDYPRREWHKHFTDIIRNTLLRHFREEGIKHHTFRLKDFTLFVPVPTKSASGTGSR